MIHSILLNRVHLILLRQGILAQITDYTHPLPPLLLEW